METIKDSRYVSMPIGELVKALSQDAQPGSKLHEEVKGALAALLSKNLVEAIDRHERAASKLAMTLLWLNIILGVFTIVGTILAVCAFVE